MVDVVASKPIAVNSTDNLVPASFQASGNLLTLTVSPGLARYYYPITVASELAEEAPPQDTVGSGNATLGCPYPAQVVTYNPNGWSQLFDALRAHATSCAQYYIVIPPPSNAKTQVRKTDSSGQRIVDQISAAGPNFHPVAEFNRGAWANASGSWQQHGQLFRKRMRGAGYGTLASSGTRSRSCGRSTSSRRA